MSRSNRSRSRSPRKIRVYKVLVELSCSITGQILESELESTLSLTYARQRLEDLIRIVSDRWDDTETVLEYGIKRFRLIPMHD